MQITEDCHEEADETKEMAQARTTLLHPRRHGNRVLCGGAVDHCANGSRLGILLAPTATTLLSSELLPKGKKMQHADQHIEAIGKTVKAKNEVSAEIFDDKVKPMGFVTVEKGKISIKLDYVPSMITTESRRDFIVDAISLSLKACFDASPDAFDPHAQS